VAKVWSIVVAGGSGQRFGQLKQFSVLGGRPVLEWAVEACRSCSAGVVLVLPAGAVDSLTYGADVVVPGGATRAESVRCGLAAVPPDAGVIVVHDAVRPMAVPELFAAVIGAVAEGGADGAVPGVPLSDTIKAVDGAGNVGSTLDRSALVAVQTPQAFRASVLRQAHEQARTGGGPDATDDAMLVEALGATVRVVPGQAGNVKITTREDLEAARRRLAGLSGDGGDGSRDHNG
jgi:2-C-methyl-D-erythritol 4-phosphate cytidylyltransferase